MLALAITLAVPGRTACQTQRFFGEVSITTNIKYQKSLLVLIASKAAKVSPGHRLIP